MHYNLRAATPADKVELGELIYLAAEGGFSESGYELSIGGTREHQVEVLASLTVTDARSWFHYSHFLVADCDGTAVAAVAGFQRPVADACLEEALGQIGWTSTEIAILNSRLEPIVGCFPADPLEAAWTIEHVAVLAPHRRRKLGGELIARQLDRGRAAGCATAHLDVFSANLPAIALYRKLGFEREAEFGDQTFQRIFETVHDVQNAPAFVTERPEAYWATLKNEDLSGMESRTRLEKPPNILHVSSDQM